MGATETSVGTGANNTITIVEKLGNTDYAAKLCYDLVVIKDGVVYNDWFLPSKDEVNQMYNVLKKNGLGGFNSGTYYYWSSSEYNSTLAWKQYFYDGTQYNHNKNYYNYELVRAARSF